MFAGNFAPRSWALTDGQLLSVASNDALFSLLGTTYGGDGRTTFGLPGLRGRAVVGAGFGPGLSLYRLGQRDGEESVMLTIPRMPNHTHELTQPADLTGNGFVDFQDLTILLANWNQVVSASEGNLVDAANTPVNFQDLTTLLAAWTGSGPAASPQAAVTELPPTDEHVSDSAPTRRTPSAAHRRIARRPMSQRDESPLRRLQATDRAMADYRAERDVISVRRSRRGR
jgi:microcystin-dependent protein